MGLCLSAGPGRCEVATYSGGLRQVRSAILVTSTASGLQNLHPHLFFVMDSRTGLKPSGVEFVNPMAPSAITADTYALWQARSGGADPAFTSGTKQYDAFKVGSRVTKKMGAYWEMNLDTMTLEDMRQFDVLYMTSVTANTVFSPVQRAKLLRFVDGGGTLWFEVGGSFASSAGGPFVIGIQSASSNFALPAAMSPGSEGHPLLSRPFRFDARAIATLRAATTVAPAATPSLLLPVIGNATGAILAAGQLGSGRIVVTSRSAGTSINDFVGDVAADGNRFALSGEHFSWPDQLADFANGVDLRQQADLMLGYNIALWSTAHGVGQSDARRTAGSSERVAPIAEPSWAAISAGASGVGSPATYRGCVYVIDATLMLHCLSLKPGTDLDGDGNPDQGLVDYNQGQPFDEIWRYDLNTVAGGASGASTPTIFEAYTAAGPVAIVAVTLSSGTTVAFPALPRTGGAGTPYAAANSVLWTAGITGATDFGLAAGVAPPAPSHSGGVLFAVANTGTGGRVIALDPLTGKSAFDSTANPDAAAIPAAGGVGTPLSAPAVGLVRDASTGALDRVLYVYTRGLNNTPPTMRSFWFSTSGEPLSLVSGSSSTFRARADRSWYVGSGSTLLTPRVYATYRDPSTGVLYSDVIASPTIQWSGQFETVTTTSSLTFTGGPTVSAGDPNVTIYADYTLDWTLPTPTTGQPPQVSARAGLPLPDPALTGLAAATGSPAITGTDAIVYAVDTTASTGATTPGRGVVVSILEQYPLNRTVVPWNYVMHNGFSMTVAGKAVQVPPRLRQLYTPVLTTDLPIDDVRDVQFRGGPAVHGDVVYVAGRATVSARPVSVVCAFRQTLDLRLRLKTPIDASAAIRIWQRNILTSGDGSRIDMSPLQYSVDRASGTIRIQSLSPPGVNVGNSASCSIPFVVQVGSGSEQIMSATTPDGRMAGPEGVDNLLWYAIIPADQPVRGVMLGQVSSGPTVSGDTIWIGFERGVASLDADPGATDAAARAAGAQVRIADTLTTTGHLRWAWSRGVVDTFDAAPVVVANTVVANSLGGVFTFQDTRTMVADASRILEVNSAGEPVWSADGTSEVPIVTSTAQLGTSQWINRVAFAKPSSVRAYGPNNLLVVDRGNNRVVRMARAGNVLWQVANVLDGLKGVMRPGDPLSLNEPSDCHYWSEPVSSLRSWSPPYSNSLPAAPGTVDHYLIADTGNFRVIELVSIMDASGAVLLDRQVNWVSSTYSSTGKRYRYISVERIREVNGNLPTSWQYDPSNPSSMLSASAIRQLTLTMVSNYRMVGNAATADQAFNTFGDTAETGGGSLVLLNENGAPLAIVSALRVPDSDTAASPAGYRMQAIVNPTSFSRFTEMIGGALTTKYLLSDANGCYQLAVNVDNLGKPALNVEWMLPAAVYRQMTGRRLQASSIRRLPASAWNAAFPTLRQFLIANRYAGNDEPTLFATGAGRPSAFRGEVFVVSASTFAFGTSSLGYVPDYLWNSTLLTMERNPLANITWRVPGETWSNGAFVRSMGDPALGTSAPVLEQPAFADRPL